MKLSIHAFTRFWDVHAWAGVVGALVLYVMFLAGSLTLFHEPLETWEEPLAQTTDATASHREAIDLAFRVGEPAGPVVWYSPGHDGGMPRIAYQRSDQSWTNAFIDVERGELVAERVRLAHFLYGLHFLWHDLTGNTLYYAAGALSVLLLLAIVTGVLIHLEKLGRQFHQFRPRKSRQVLFSDLHKVLAVMGLPFQSLYAYTGALIVLGPLLLPAFVGPVFDGDGARARRVAFGRDFDAVTEAGSPTTPLAADELLTIARRTLPELVVETVRIEHHGRENGSFEVWGLGGSTPDHHVRVSLRESDGVVVTVASPANEEVAGGVRRWVYGLHFAHFGGWPLRFLFFTLGLAGCATLLTGNWIWISRRRATAGADFLERLTAGVGAGTLVAVAAMFLSSRLLPLTLEGRGSYEELGFVGALVTCLCWAFASRDVFGLWWKQLALAGLLLLPVPLLAARWSSAGLFGAASNAQVLGVDVALLASASLLLAVAFALRARARVKLGRLATSLSTSTARAVDGVAFSRTPDA